MMTSQHPIRTRWELIYRKLTSLDGLRLSRWVNRGSDTNHRKLYGFAYASSVAYAAAVYICITSISGETLL